MLNFHTAIQQQNNIELLCLPKEPTNFELYAPNNNYGFASILKDYTGYPRNRPIMGIIPHGVYLNESKMFGGELECPLPGVFNYPPYRNKIWDKMAKKKQIISSASPILYALKLINSEFDHKNRKGTLFFPPHSTALVDTIYDKEKIVKTLENIPEEYQPVTLCIHWHDIHQGLHKYFFNKGFQVVSAGHLYDENFIYRWLHLVSQFKQTMGMDITSALFYSVAAGIPHTLVNIPIEYEYHKNFQLSIDKKTSLSKQTQQRKKKLWQLFSDSDDQISEEQKDLVNYYLGAEFLQSPKKLFQLFETVNFKKG